MSHAHNPNSLNINLGNILGARASVAQSARFREQMRGGAMAAAMASPTRGNQLGHHHHHHTARAAAASAVAAAPSQSPSSVATSVPITLTHRGGQNSGGTVWENKDYWERRQAQKQARRAQRDRSHLGYHGHGGSSSGGRSSGYGGGYANRSSNAYDAYDTARSRPGTYPEYGLGSGSSVGSNGAYSARSNVPRLSLDANALAASREFKPPLHRRGGSEVDFPGYGTGGTGNAGRALLAAGHDYGDSLNAVMEEHHGDSKGVGRRGRGRHGGGGGGGSGGDGASTAWGEVKSFLHKLKALGDYGVRYYVTGIFPVNTGSFIFNSKDDLTHSEVMAEAFGLTEADVKHVLRTHAPQYVDAMDQIRRDTNGLHPFNSTEPLFNPQLVQVAVRQLRDEGKLASTVMDDNQLLTRNQLARVLRSTQTAVKVLSGASFDGEVSKTVSPDETMDPATLLFYLGVVSPGEPVRVDSHEVLAAELRIPNRATRQHLCTSSSNARGGSLARRSASCEIQRAKPSALF